MEQGAIDPNGSGSKSIRVEFREAVSDDIVIVTHIESDELPETFEQHTTLDLGVGLFDVVRAEPLQRALFVRSGELKLWLRRKEQAPDTSANAGNEQLFAPPTKQSELPSTRAVESSYGVGVGVSDSDVADFEDELDEDFGEEVDLLLMYDEDWRQNELIAAAHHARVGLEFDRIALTMPGLTHARATLERPLEGLALSPEQLLHALDGERFDGVALCHGEHDPEREVCAGFAIESAEGTIFYGRLDSRGMISELGVHVWEGATTLIHDLERVASLLPDPGEVLFVSWCSSSATPLSKMSALVAKLEG